MGKRCQRGVDLVARQRRDIERLERHNLIDYRHHNHPLNATLTNVRMGEPIELLGEDERGQLYRTSVRLTTPTQKEPKTTQTVGTRPIARSEAI